MKNSLLRAELLSLAIPSGPICEDRATEGKTVLQTHRHRAACGGPTCRSTSGSSCSSCCWDCGGKAAKVRTLMSARMLVLTRMEPGVSKSTSSPPRFLFMGPVTEQTGVTLLLLAFMGHAPAGRRTWGDMFSVDFKGGEDNPGHHYGLLPLSP